MITSTRSVVEISFTNNSCSYKYVNVRVSSTIKLYMHMIYSHNDIMISTISTSNFGMHMNIICVK